jgi:hypothetical protein
LLGPIGFRRMGRNVSRRDGAHALTKVLGSRRQIEKHGSPQINATDTSQAIAHAAGAEIDCVKARS